MTRCLDIHTHHAAPCPESVVAVTPGNFNPVEGQWYSVGIHPWDTNTDITSSVWKNFEYISSLSNIVAIGECGIDKLKGGPLFRQLSVMKKQIEISEKIHKPLIIHDVKAHDIIVGLKKDLKPKQKWLVHGFRGKPSVAKMLTDAGIYLSFGQFFNLESPSAVPLNMVLAETDESELSILQIIDLLSLNLEKDMLPVIIENTAEFLSVEI